MMVQNIRCWSICSQQLLLREILAHIDQWSSHCIDNSQLTQSVRTVFVPLGETRLYLRASVLQEIKMKSVHDITLHETQAQWSGHAHQPSKADHTEMGLELFSGLSKFLWSTCWAPCFCLSVKIGGSLGVHKSEVSPSKMPEIAPAFWHSKVKLCMWMTKLDPRCELTCL